MIHIAGRPISMTYLRAIPLKRPKRAKRFWQGIPHGKLVDEFINQIEERGWGITSKTFAVGKDEADLAGAFGLKIRNVKTPKGVDLALGFLTSNALRHRLRVYVGGVVRICTNGMASGQVILKRKHTTGLELGDQISEALDQYMENTGSLYTTVAALQREEVGEGDVDRILMMAGRAGLIPWSHIGMVDAEYHEPTFDFKPGTAWALFNAFTHIAKRSPPVRQIQAIDGFRDLMLGKYFAA